MTDDAPHSWNPMTERPFFSIIMPVYNRAAVVGRAITSCLTQSFPSFEIVVVDDGSSDDSVAVVHSYDDPRLRLLVHEQNRGVSPARNTAMADARGEWFVFLDSDDELLPGALETIHRRAIAANETIGALRFMCVDGDGTSPEPAHCGEILDYEGYVRWLDQAVKQEALPCARTSTFPAVRYPDSRALERSYHLDLARTTLVQTCSEVLRRYHHDMADRLTVPVAERALRQAADDADDTRNVLAVHGEALRRFAPRTYRMTLTAGASACFMAGRRLEGLRYAVRAWPLMPFSPRLYAIVALGLLGRAPVAKVRALRTRIMRRRVAVR
jgi:glycosyltransferase involved in cell wall biosynthesis